jgi:hypothetical protein
MDDCIRFVGLADHEGTLQAAASRNETVSAISPDQLEIPVRNAVTGTRKLLEHGVWTTMFTYAFLPEAKKLMIPLHSDGHGYMVLGMSPHCDHNAAVMKVFSALKRSGLRAS